MRIPIIAGNWKMNTTITQAIALVRRMRVELDKITNVEKVICPPFVSLAILKKQLKESSIKLGAQNLFFEEKGAYTGEISPLMLIDLCQYVIIGHSERRQYFSENNEIINKKIRAALKFGLIPILCVGESLSEHSTGRTEEIVTGQLKSSLSGIKEINGLVVAYEPIWAIGSGRAATGQQANETIGYIRNEIARLFNVTIANNLRILYGGSVTAVNTGEFIKQNEIDGALVGGACLKASDFIDIIKQTSILRN